MSLFHAVILIDHQSAQVLQFGAGQLQEHTMHARLDVTRQHGSTVRTEHEFFGQVCDALDGVAQVLVAGGRTGLADFRHFAEKHRPQTASRITGYEVVDHPSDKELVALARTHFLKHEQMAGIALPR
jgi:hypothetical protein